MEKAWIVDIGAKSVGFGSKRANSSSRRVEGCKEDRILRKGVGGSS